MAAAYAALVSLLNTMDQIQIHPRLSTLFDKYQLESLLLKVDFFLEFVEKYSDGDSIEVEDLVRRISVAAHEAEDVIEVEAADRIRGGSVRKSVTLLLNLQRIIQEMNSVEEKVVKFKEDSRFPNDQQLITSSSMAPPPSPSSSSRPSLATAKTTMVGFDCYLAQLLDELTGHYSGRKVLPIVGMGGIGKTTLARNVYEHSLIVYHFDVRVWVTVSQEFNAGEIILQALDCLGGSKSRIERSDDKVGEELYRILFGRRYLIVLDDVWSVEAWETIKFFFPENNNRSRIVITTRQSELVDYFASSAIVLGFLDDKNSWELFCMKTFAKQGCPPQLEQVGKKIVKKCKGLPLAIIVIGGILGNSPRAQEYWERLAQDKSLILEYSSEENKIFSILYLSYKHLPVCLKSCFLYLGLFPEDYSIHASQLIKLWIAEGFIKPNANQSFEQVAEGYVKDLVNRNLILAGHSNLDRKLTTFFVHDLVRDLCIRVAEKEKYYSVQRDIDGKRHLIVDRRNARLCHGISPTPSLMYPLILEGQRMASFKSRLLRVLACDWQRMAFPLRFPFPFPFREVNLKFLFYDFLGKRTCYKLDSSISQLWRLQYLIVDGSEQVIAPSEIWKMPQLRHIEFWSIHVPEPPRDEVLALQNLHTLKRVYNLNFTEEVCKRIPNIKELHIHYDFREHVEHSSYNQSNVVCLDKLESLHYSCKGWVLIRRSLQIFEMPSSLKELTLHGSKLLWSDMGTIGSLPFLENLQLLDYAVLGPEWNCVEVEGQFLRLRHLRIQGCYDLINWIASRSSFPVLETLYLLFLFELDEVPQEIGDVPTLHRVFMYDCSESATVSAVKLLEEQENNLGNECILLELEFFDKTRAEKMREKIEESGFTCQHLLINGRPR